MYRCLLLLLLPLAVHAQDDTWDDDEWGDDWENQEQRLVWTGFVEAAFGTRIYDDALVDNQNTLEDLRARVETRWEGDPVTLGFKVDAGYDGVENSAFLDIRELSLAFSIGERTDVSIGRQVQTWGTGDLLFLNDLFPKDFVSFFAGRDDEYLKAPGNVVRLSHYADAFNVDFVWTPVFEPDVYLTGERFSFFSPIAGGNVAPNPPLSAIEPDKTLSNGEFALRLFKTVESTEYAVYLYRGFNKQPRALTASLEPTFAPLSTYGASMRKPLSVGLFNAEFSYFDSRNDRDGTDPLIPNDQFRILAGYEWEAKQNFTVGLQYYLEWTLDHDELTANSPFPEYEPDEFRHLLTNRLTYRAGMDRFTWSLFTFWSPSDRDFYVRPLFTYRRDDHWTLSAGASLFGGDQPYTFFNQLQDASNVYVRLRYNY